MKKPLSVLLATCMLITALAGCGKSNSTASTETAAKSSETAATESAVESTAQSAESTGETTASGDAITLKLGVPTAPTNTACPSYDGGKYAGRQCEY